jgi:hypothetical protein
MQDRFWAHQQGVIPTADHEVVHRVFPQVDHIVQDSIPIRRGGHQNADTFSHFMIILITERQMKRLLPQPE